MDKTTKDGLLALALLGFFYILLTFVLPIVGIGFLIASLIWKSLTFMWIGLGAIFGPYVLSLLLGLIGITLKKPTR